jgi:ribonuclease E
VETKVADKVIADVPVIKASGKVTSHEIDLENKPSKTSEVANVIATDQVEIPSAEEKSDKKPRNPRRRKPAQSKPVDLAASGLQLVETKADTIQVSPTPEAEVVTKKPRKSAAWQQKTNENSQDEPLVIVQTQK